MERTKAQQITLEAFRNGPTHANRVSYDVKDIDSFVVALAGTNLNLFEAYLQFKHVKTDDFNMRRVYARIYAETIRDIILDYIDKHEGGELDEPV